MTNSESRLRIGELARRTGVSPEALRAWERRYGLLQPSRTTGGFRLYGAEDLTRIREMRRLLAEGLSTSEAAAQVLRGSGATEPASTERPSLLAERRNELHQSIMAFDESRAQASLDHLLGEFQLELVIKEVLLPELREIGELWSGGDTAVAEEHFASNLIRGRLGGLARGWDEGTGPLALLACPPGELHDLPLMMFGIALRRRGWRVIFLGAETPAESLADAVQSVAPDAVVLAATNADRFAAVAHELALLARTTRVAIGGAGASAEFASSLGLTFLEGDPITAAAIL